MSKGGGGVYVSFDIKETASLLLSLGFLLVFSSFVLDVFHALFKSYENLHKQGRPPPQSAPLFLFDELGLGLLSFRFKEQKLCCLDRSLLVSRMSYF